MSCTGCIGCGSGHGKLCCSEGIGLDVIGPYVAFSAARCALCNAVIPGPDGGGNCRFIPGLEGYGLGALAFALTAGEPGRLPWVRGDLLGVLLLSSIILVSGELSLIERSIDLSSSIAVIVMVILVMCNLLVPN